ATGKYGRVRRRVVWCVVDRGTESLTMEPNREQQHLPGASLWPIGFALGIACVLVGLVISWIVAGRRGASALFWGHRRDRRARRPGSATRRAATRRPRPRSLRRRGRPAPPTVRRLPTSSGRRCRR